MEHLKKALIKENIITYNKIFCMPPYGIVDLANKLFRGPGNDEVWINHKIVGNYHTVHAG